MGRSSPEMTPPHSDIEKGCLEFEHGLSSFQKESFTIFKVPHRLREVNEKAYEPNVISVGPYHYRKPHLARMEGFKKRQFENIVEKTHLGLHQFREAMKHLEGKTRKCYEQPLHPDLEVEEKFVDMMVYDGCFVVQLIWIGHLYDFRELGQHVSYDMRYDLLLLENQLPFFVLLELYRMIIPNPGPRGHLSQLAAFALTFFGRHPIYVPENTSIRHLLQLVHDPSQEIRVAGTEVEYCFPKNKFQSSRSLIPSATELEDAGIHFFGVSIQNMQNQEKGKMNMFDIEFDNDTKELKIPTLKVDHSTERTFRNYMAYEQLWGVRKYYVDYVLFMDKLINTGKDVELLRKSGIIDNWLGDDEAVTKIFNKLGYFVYYDTEAFYYEDIADRVNKHCKRDWNKWKAKLKKDYFNTPWSPISFLAGLLLLLITIVQTIFSLLSYYQQRQENYRSQSIIVAFFWCFGLLIRGLTSALWEFLNFRPHLVTVL
ncbi:hypothetical protein CXB51_034476 [Gossypium anomalum]|uniref:Uncharacterized protein n=1 Tax=Gossypium anomalum TaxID=47600 RepID=A0A8J6CLJ4_9ROSI|nr:hypothetical protein CXB51_034476 [Gossypium anomalum]